MRARQKASLVLIVGTVAAMPLLSQAQSQGLNLAAPHVPDEVLIQFTVGIGSAQRHAVLARFGMREQELLSDEATRSDHKGDLSVVKLPPGLAVAAAVSRLGADPSVQFVEPNWIYTHDATSNDPYYTNGSLWGMYGDATSPANQYGSQAGEAWAGGNVCSSDVVVGIIDEGVFFNHVDLKNNVWENPSEIAGDSIDNDGNGYIDDIHGWDFVGNDNTIYDGPADDHGTHVAGTIAATGGNGLGVAGMCWNVKFVVTKFLGNAGGTTENAIKAIDYMVDLKMNRGVNLVALNNSWGGGGFSQGLMDAIERANNAGILFVAAAGNGGGDGKGDNNDVTPHYPSSYSNDNVIAVAAIDKTGKLASFSNYGATSVDLGAPGVGIYSTLPSRKSTSTYGSYSGTSMATPHVTGAAALYASHVPSYVSSYVSAHPDATPADIAAFVKDAILSGAAPTTSLSGKTSSGGRLDVSKY